MAAEAVALQFSLSQKKVNQSIGTQAVAAHQYPQQYNEYAEAPVTEVAAQVPQNEIDPALVAARRLVAEIQSQSQPQSQPQSGLRTDFDLAA